MCMLDGDVSIFDLLGQVITKKHISGTNADVISIDTKSAIYVVRYTSSVQTITKQIFINK